MMSSRGTRGAYRKEDRVALPSELKKELVEKAAAKYGNCQELAKHLNIPKSSVHYYRIGRLTMPISVLEKMLRISGDAGFAEKVRRRGITKDRTWANEYSSSIMREMYREKVRLPTLEELRHDEELRKKAAAIVSYIMAEGSIWLQKSEWGEHAVNITFAEHEMDLYNHFRTLCSEVFCYDIGSAQLPGNGAAAIRGFIYSRFVAEWLIENGVKPGEKSAQRLRLPRWVVNSGDPGTWIAALQPWCDGEGCVHSGANSRNSRFSIAQSAHSDMDISIVPISMSNRVNRSVARGRLLRMCAFDIPLLDYTDALFRSEILDDTRRLFMRLGFSPRMRMTALRYKEDGFWSCIWTLGFGVEDTRRLFDMGLVTQAEKARTFHGR
jgi:hypothetical protein